MSLSDRMRTSPLAIYVEHCQRGELAYQVSGGDGLAVFYPRLVCPRTGSGELEWRTSGGVGTVYSSTTVHQRDRPPYNVSVIDMAEGFRIMSRVEDIDPDVVAIGMAVALKGFGDAGKELPYPLFAPVRS